MMERLNDYLVDRFFAGDQPSFKIEQPAEGCPCLSYGLLSKEWVYGRPSKCDCPQNTDDYDNVLHSLDCDSVVCPFCALETSREE